MRKKIIFIDFLITSILLLIILGILLLFIFHKGIGEIKIGNRIYYFDFVYFGIILFYYSIIKSVLGIILFTKNIIQKNIVIISKKISFLFIPSLLLIIYIGYFLINELLQPWIWWKMVAWSIILIIGIIALLGYLILNKTLNIKIYYKIILSIILPISYFAGYFLIWVVINT